MIKFTTLNSLYEVDQDQQRVRRLNGLSDPTPYQGIDGEWKSYTKISNIQTGLPVLIVWENTKCTTTSVVQLVTK